MSRANHSPVQRQLGRVSRRLFTQVLLDSLYWCLGGALVLATIWFLVQPWLLESPPEWLRWVVAGGITGLALVLAVALAMLRRPSEVTAALSLDEKFNLRERVTTSLTLSPHLAETPAAMALLDDVNQRVDKLNVGERFPVRLTWNAALLPVGAAFLAIVAILYNPVFDRPQAPAADNSDKVPNADEIDKKIAQVKVEKKARDKNADKPEEEKDPDLKKFEDDLDRIFSKPRDTKDALNKRVDEMQDLKKKIDDHQKDLEEKNKALKDQLQQAERLNKKQSAKNGPAKELEKALKNGDLDKAKEEVDKLAKKLKNNELTKEEQKDLQDQIQDIKEKLEQLTRTEEEEEKLKELARNGEIDQDQLNRELEQLRKNAEKMKDNQKDLEEIADQLAECKRCMKDGDGEGAAKALARAGAKMNKLDNSEELKQLGKQAEQVEELRRMMCKGCRNDSDKDGGQPNPGAGRRPIEDDETGNQKTRITGEQDQKGRKEIVGTAPGSNFRTPRKPEDLTQEIKNARQEAPEALERQRIPRAASDIAKGYFENLGSQKEPPKKSEKP